MLSRSRMKTILIGKRTPDASGDKMTNTLVSMSLMYNLLTLMNSWVPKRDFVSLHLPIDAT